MASSKEIRTKIKSVQGTRKITKAMEMVAAAKMRKAQERMRTARPYGDKIRNIAAHHPSPRPVAHRVAPMPSPNHRRFAVNGGPLTRRTRRAPD